MPEQSNQQFRNLPIASDIYAKFHALWPRSTVNQPYATYFCFLDIFTQTKTDFIELADDATVERATHSLHITTCIVEALLAHSHGRNDLVRVALATLQLTYPEHWQIPATVGIIDMIDGRYEHAQRTFEGLVLAHPSIASIAKALATLYELQGNLEAANGAWLQSYADERVRFTPSTGLTTPVRVLIVESALAGNIVYARFLDAERFALTAVFPEHLAAGKALPEHDIVFHVISDPELCAPSLQAAALALHDLGTTVMNPPHKIIATGRSAMAQRLQNIPDVLPAKMHEFTREELLQDDAAALMVLHGFTYPYLIRSAGFANGQFFEKIETDEQLHKAVLTMPRAAIIAMTLLPTRDTFGLYRKYRVVHIDGIHYPVHLAISRHWKVHYYSSDMNENAEYRDEEKRFLENMDIVLGAKALSALDAIFKEIDLDYSGIDFSLNENGQVFVFEANASMGLHDPDSDERWNYRRGPIQRAQQAAAAFVIKRAKRASGLADSTI